METVERAKNDAAERLSKSPDERDLKNSLMWLRRAKCPQTENEKLGNSLS